MNWIELDIQVSQTGFGFEGYLIGGQDTLIRGSSRIISFDEFFVHVFLRDQFQNGLEEVGI
jgi:hypothetical protein